MLIIRPHPASLARTGSSPTYVYSAWTSSGSPYYALDAVVRYQVSSVWYDYRCRRGHTASSSRSPTNTYYWTKIGVASTTGGYTYTTNVRLSAASAWANGAAITAGQVVFDDADQSDYIATIAISAGDNTLRPSEAIRSATATVAARWVCLGKANAWAWSDTEINSRLEGYDASNNLILPAFTIDAGVLAYAVDRICFSGFLHVESLTAKVYVDGALQQTLTKSLGYGATGYLLTSAVLAFTPVAVGKALTIEVTLSRAVLSLPPSVGAIVIGYGYQLATTEWDVETSLLGFSRQERNTTYGTISFLPRGSAKVVRATGYLDPAVSSGDHLLQLIAWLSGAPIYFDLNEDGTDYDRLRLYGICTRASSIIKAASWESIGLDLEGLVE